MRALTLVGDYLYAAWNTPSDTGGITVYSLADPAHPVAVAEIDDYVDSDSKRPSGLAAFGDYVYLGDADNGLIVLDASDPLAPVNLGMVEGVHEFDQMGVYGDRLLTTGSSWLGGRVVHVIDLSDPAAPVEVGSASLDGGTVLRAVLTDGYAIGVGLDLLVYDLRDPANITQVFDAPIDEATQAIRAGDTLYLVRRQRRPGLGFHRRRAAPTLLRTVAIDAFVPDQADRHAVRSAGADAYRPRAAVRCRRSAQSDARLGVHAAVRRVGARRRLRRHARVFRRGRLRPRRVAGPTLDWLGRYDADLPPDLAARDMEDISIDGGRAYLAAWGYGVLIADLTDPAAPGRARPLPVPVREHDRGARQSRLRRQHDQWRHLQDPRRRPTQRILGCSARWRPARPST